MLATICTTLPRARHVARGRLICFLDVTIPRYPKRSISLMTMNRSFPVDLPIRSHTSKDDSNIPCEGHANEHGGHSKELGHQNQNVDQVATTTPAESDATNVSLQPTSTVSEGATAEPSYTISSELLDNARAAAEDGEGPFWSHSLYRSSSGAPVRVHYCTSKATAETVTSSFLQDKVIGFDMEWESGAQPGRNTIKDNVSVIQLAAMDRVAILHLAMFRGDQPHDLMPESLKTLLESDTVTKAGVNIAGDFTRLRRCFYIEGKGLFELSHMYKLVRYSQTEPELINRMPASLGEQVQNIFNLPLYKGGEVRMSAWATKLSNDQISYAVSDAYAGIRLYDELDRQRRALDPEPPLPAHYELGRPILLANGLPPPRKQIKPRPASPTTIASEKTDQDDAASSIAASEEATESSEQQRVDDEQMNGEDEGDSMPENVASPAKTDVRFLQAEKWAQSHFATLTAVPGARRVAIKPAALRAYALWHQHDMTPEEVAQMLRSPPLKISTVSTYIAEAIVFDSSLPFDHDRLRLVFVSMPGFIALRFKKLARLLGLT